ncbi:LysR family transcriptional regulator [Fusibacter paucivorans]|uniref:LysR family transcriptional regulator n=1 Tax=Fusibacter paucivorans TaxID=76009 RepID=A0ABS5PQK1_9FIRM|nr:LysR family transcriptional regulator [Fusibacter paucivorans]MBS7527443.1 LysR family transcriptional regulator [Fusibacter paucivorans]
MGNNRYFHLSNINLNINQLSYFITVAETLSFSKAAKQLFVPQSAVSQKIMQLEERLQMKLFIRTNRMVKLTSAGKHFYEIATKMLAETEEAISVMKAADAGSLGTVNIGFLAGPVINFLPDLLNHFKRRYPQIVINLKHLTLPELIEGIKEEKLDIVFAVPFGFNAVDGINSALIYGSDIGVYMSSENPLASKTSLRIHELETSAFIMRERSEFPQWYDHVIKLCVEEGFHPQITHQVKRLEPLMIFIASGMGITIMPRYLHYYAPNTVRFVPLTLPNAQIEIRLYQNADCHNPAANVFYEEALLMIEKQSAAGILGS